MEIHPSWGFWKSFSWMRWKGSQWNHKRVWRVYCQMGLNLPRRRKRKVIRDYQPLEVKAEINVSWTLDFMRDSLYCGKPIRILNVLDEGVRECLAIEVDTALPATRLIQVLDRVISWRGIPKQIRVDNVLTAILFFAFSK